MPLPMKLLDIPVWITALTFSLFVFLIKYPKYVWLVLPLLFLLDLGINNFLTVQLKPFNYSFDWEKIVISNPGNLKLIDRYWHEDLWLPFRIRNVFYSPWLLSLSWLDLIFKLLSPVFLIRIVGFSGLFLFVLGIIHYFGDQKRKIWPLIWILTVVAASGLGMLVDSKSAYILALPAIIYFLFLGISSRNFNKLWKYWFGLLIIDVLSKW